MYLPTQPQSDAARVWLEATRQVFSKPQHEAYNVVLDLERQLICDKSSSTILQLVDNFLRLRGAKPLMTVANTIFPNALYQRHGATGLFDSFHNVLLPYIRRDCNWSGYYFERMTKVKLPSGEFLNPLQDVIRRVKDPNIRANNKYEIAIFDPVRDLSDSPYGGQCLSHLSFKVVGNSNRKLLLSVMYRNHFYVEKLLGNLIGLSQLLSFVAREAGVEPGSLTVFSTHATATQQCHATVKEISKLINDCTNVLALPSAA